MDGRDDKFGGIKKQLNILLSQSVSKPLLMKARHDEKESTPSTDAQQALRLAHEQIVNQTRFCIAFLSILQDEIVKLDRGNRDHVENEIMWIAKNISNAIYKFKERLRQDPLNLCRVSKGRILWTSVRHREIEQLQEALAPLFVQINALLSEDKSTHITPEFSESGISSDDDSVSSESTERSTEEKARQRRSSRSFYSGAGRQKASSQQFTILESTPFGRLLESKAMQTLFEETFAKDATQQCSQEEYKELNGQIVIATADNMGMGGVHFNVHIDKAAMFGIWEATSSCYARENIESEVHVFVPLGILPSSVFWSFELQNIRKEKANIIIHSLKDPTFYENLNSTLNQKKQELKSLTSSSEDQAKKIVLEAELNSIKEQMDKIINDESYWKAEPLDSKMSDVKIGKIPVSKLKTIAGKLCNRNSVQQSLYDVVTAALKLESESENIAVNNSESEHGIINEEDDSIPGQGKHSF